MKKIIITSIIAGSVLMAGGWKIPETSTNSVALGGANIAHVRSADAAYDNPANMAFMSDTNQLEVDLMYIGLSDTKFTGTVGGTGPYDLNAEKQTFVLPSLHYVSPKLGDTKIRLGLSVVVPGGLTREWKKEPAKTSAEEFSLKIIEINPTIAYAINDTFSLALGIRAVYSDGVVKSNGTALVAAGPTYSVLSRDLKGTSIDYGYNLALAYKPTKNLEFGLTYRSNVDLTIEGDALLASSVDFASYDGVGSVSVPLPATVSLAAAYTFPTNTTIEFVYERAFWSVYESLDFSYEGVLGSAILTGAFDDPITKNWNDTNTFRLGVTQDLDAVTLMAGFVMDETPTPEKTLNFESPGSDSISVSFGARYAMSETLDIAISTLYSMKEDRTITNNDNGIDGEFTNSNVLLISAGVGYKF